MVAGDGLVCAVSGVTVGRVRTLAGRERRARGVSVALRSLGPPRGLASPRWVAERKSGLCEGAEPLRSRLDGARAGRQTRRLLLCQICLLAEERVNSEGRLGWGEGNPGE